MSKAKIRNGPPTRPSLSPDDTELIAARTKVKSDIERTVKIREKALAALESMPITSARDAIDILTVTMTVETALRHSMPTALDRFIEEALNE
jgi:hypothetical protein